MLRPTARSRNRPRSRALATTRRGQRLPENLRPLIPSAQIQRRLAGLAREIEAAVPPEERPLAIVVLQGAFVFAADLLRRFSPDYPIELAFLRCESYGSGTISSGRVVLVQDLDGSVDLRNRTVLLIDDILDSGLTARYLMQHLSRRGAERVRLCVLLRRRGANESEPDFCGFSIGPEFVVGYGMDHNGRFRNLRDLSALVRG